MSVLTIGNAGGRNWATLLADCGVGLAATSAILPASLLLGGFSFIEPWVLVTALLFFFAGFLRGTSPGNASIKAMAINLGPLCLLVVWLRAEWLTMLLGVLAVILPTMAGLLARRRKLKSNARRSAAADQSIV